MLYPESVVLFTGQEYPGRPGEPRAQEHARFDAATALNALHVYIFGKDSLVAQLTLKNVESGATTVKRTPVVSLDLAA
jgi:hypothetical protein